MLYTAGDGARQTNGTDNMKTYRIKTETMGIVNFTDEFTIDAADRKHLNEQLRDRNIHPDTKITITEQ